MHEVGIISAMLKTLERVMEEEGLTHVEKVVLEVGELSGVVPHYMEECFPAAIYQTPFEDLKMEIIPGMIQCLDCEAEFPVRNEELKCPECGSDKIKPAGGTGFIIKEIYGS